jgi:hypothetical protein
MTKLNKKCISEFNLFQKRQNRFYKEEREKLKELMKVTPATINQTYDYYV